MPPPQSEMGDTYMGLLKLYSTQKKCISLRNEINNLLIVIAIHYQFGYRYRELKEI